MRLINSASIVLLALLFAAGCGAGRAFVRPEPGSLLLGRTTAEEIAHRFGTPYREGRQLANGENVTFVVYAYLVAGAGALGSEINPARTISFHFHQGILVGHEYRSSFQEDHTNFDSSRLGELREGGTTESEVITLLGPPHGAQIYPLVKGRDDRAIVYMYAQVLQSTESARRLFSKRLVVTLDRAGVVKEVEFIEGGRQ